MAKSLRCIFVLPIGLDLIAFGIVALKAECGGFAWGIAIPSILFGLVLAGTGIGVGTLTRNWSYWTVSSQPDV